MTKQKKFKYKSNLTKTLIAVWGGLTFFSGISGYIIQEDLTILILTTLVLGSILTVAAFFYDLKRIELFIKSSELTFSRKQGTQSGVEDQIIDIDIACEEAPPEDLYEEEPE